MRPSTRNKILIVFTVLLIFWLLSRALRLLIPLIIIAVIIGGLWDWVDRGKKNGRNKYDRR